MTEVIESNEFDHVALLSEIEQLVNQKKWEQLRVSLDGVPTPEIADIFQELSKRNRVLFFHALPREMSAAIFSYMEFEKQNQLLALLSEDDTRQLLANLAPDDRTTLLEELPGQVTQRLLNLLSPSDLQEARQLLGYPEESIGRLMTPDYVAVRPSWTISHALSHLRKTGKTSETISIIYVTDHHWKLLDALPLRSLIVADPDAKIEDLMDHSFVSLSAFEDREEAVHALARYDVVALPVVDSTGVLLGIVTVDDVLDVAEEEATEDFHKSAAVSPLKTTYRDARVLELFRKRIGWLLVLILVNLLSSGVIAAFEETLAAVIALAFFIPLLIGSGGNAGAQSATLMVRAIATGDITRKQWFFAMSKEVLVGLSLGVAMGLASSILGIFRGGIALGIVVGISMAAIVLVANLVGTLLPFILTRLNLDPAVASSPLVTTIADASGLLIYFSIAAYFLSAGYLAV